MILVGRGAAPGRALMVCWRSSSSWLDWSGSARSSRATCEIHARRAAGGGRGGLRGGSCVVVRADLGSGPGFLKGVGDPDRTDVDLRPCRVGRGAADVDPTLTDHRIDPAERLRFIMARQ